MGGVLQGWTIQGFMGRVMIDTQQGGGSYVGGRWAPAGLRVRAARASATYARRPGFALLVLGVTLLAHAGCGSQPTDNNDTDISVRQLTELANNAVPFEQDPVIQLRQVPDQKLSLDLPSGDRHYLLGAVPIGAPSPNLTTDALFRAIATVGLTAECFVIRQKIDWEAFRPGGNAVPEFTQDIVVLLNTARDNGFTRTLVELDPIVDRHHVGPLPPAIADHDFSSPDVRQALRLQALIVAQEAKPTYLSLGVEVNGYYESNPADFANFVSLHKEIYDEIKAVSPDTVVMASFNLEAIQGLLAGVNDFSNHGPQWFILDMFSPKIDAVAFSTLPFPVYYDPLQIPDDYLSRIQEHTALPIVLSEVGWHSNEDSNSNQTRQREYLARMIRLANRTANLHVLAWTIMFDAADGSVFDAFPDFKYLGLLSWEGEPKEGFSLWEALYDNPYVPPVQE